MKRKDFGAKPLSYPQPVWIIATYDENGVPGKPTITKTVLRFPRDMNIFTACGLTAVAYQLDDTLQIRRGNDVLCEVRSDAVCCVSDLI